MTKKRGKSPHQINFGAKDFLGNPKMYDYRSGPKSKGGASSSSSKVTNFLGRMMVQRGKRMTAREKARASIEREKIRQAGLTQRLKLKLQIERERAKRQRRS